jgi:transcriptional regulator
MYVPGHFSEDRKEVLHELIRAYPLGALVCAGPTGLEANHIPFLLEESGNGSVSLSGHIARANRIWEELEAGGSALVIFQGPSAYISPGWYPSKLEHGKVVPTWNYVVVHAQGTLRFHHDAIWIRNQLERLTCQMEAGRPAPWAVSDAPAEYIEKMIAHVVGVELVVKNMTGKWKASQNQPDANRTGVIHGLENTGDTSASKLARWLAEFSRTGR